MCSITSFSKIITLFQFAVFVTYLAQDVFSIYTLGYVPKSRVQVRRTDKLRRDTVFHPIEQYMQYVEEWYQQQYKRGMEVTQKRVYLATDSPSVVKEATRKYILLKFLYLSTCNYYTSNDIMVQIT